MQGFFYPPYPAHLEFGLQTGYLFANSISEQSFFTTHLLVNACSER